MGGTRRQIEGVIITEPVNLAAGEVEVIILQSVPVAEPLSETEAPTKITALQDWFENTEPAPPDFDPDQARWEALKEKYDL
ncbi:hypothetical protein [Leptolyngbya sp. 7M]|uniref:hypothetical protein n=1 Tax=Leptolyngbya sp. 7M TaxID=2812896 RepID=UPI001B8B25F6|nr:hypothetical protein [Leptolyngbya sp. 7M]QYO64945.1 hypothetical protein JVX88_36370 [Leptolyngbya sp. 7M]